MLSASNHTFSSYCNITRLETQQTYRNNADQQTFKAIDEIVQSTWNPDLVGQGQDAKDLDHDTIVVIDVQQVENKPLFQSYDQKRKQLLQKVKNCKVISNFPAKLDVFKEKERELKVNEFYLFHGTSPDSVLQIAKEGFDASKADPKSMFGKGIYFTDSFTKADQYADEKDNRDDQGAMLNVLLCRVLLGNTFKCQRLDADRFIHPPCMKCEQDDCCCGSKNWFDSIMATGMLFREFVVYNGAQCYPEFIISYKRNSNKERRTQSTHVAIRTHAKAIEYIENNHSGDKDFSPVSKVNEFYQKTKITPSYDFKIVHPRHACTWICECKLESVNITAQGQGLRKKFAKRNAARQVWDCLKTIV